MSERYKLQLGDKLSRLTALAACLLLAFAGCERSNHRRAAILAVSTPTPTPPVVRPLPADAAPQLKQFLERSGPKRNHDRLRSLVRQDRLSQRRVSSETGVCSDVVVRAFRKVGIDLQKEVHEDMQRAWADYPRRWGARGTDTNIDHRRVLNLMKYFERSGKSQPSTDVRADYKPGDVVAWQLSEGVEHIGIVANLSSQPDKHYLIVHNIGGGVRLEDGLLSWKIIGHYRYF